MKKKNIIITIIVWCIILLIIYVYWTHINNQTYRASCIRNLSYDEEMKVYRITWWFVSTDYKEAIDICIDWFKAKN